ncbi:rab gtpase activator [Pelomyxa schiedti]|nr:rab gtpase activator [Pelomyxa schiedti]
MSGVVMSEAQRIRLNAFTQHLRDFEAIVNLPAVKSDPGVYEDLMSEITRLQSKIELLEPASFENPQPSPFEAQSTTTTTEAQEIPQSPSTTSPSPNALGDSTSSTTRSTQSNASHRVSSHSLVRKFTSTLQRNNSKATFLPPKPIENEFTVKIILPKPHHQSVYQTTCSITTTVSGFVSLLIENFFPGSDTSQFHLFIPICFTSSLMGLWLEESRTVFSYELSSLKEPVLILFEATPETETLDSAIFTWLRKNLSTDSMVVKWMEALGNWDLIQKSNIGTMVLSLPPTLRGFVWQKLSESEIFVTENPGLYQKLVCDDVSTEFERRIRVDLKRTLPKHPFFQSDFGQDCLQRVLRAYAAYNTEVGYCQGMNFISAILLLHMSEESTFWMLHQLIKKYKLSGFFVGALPRLHSSLEYFSSLVQYTLPDVYDTFQTHGIPYLSLAGWFHTLFVTVLDPLFVSRLWDLFLIHDYVIIYQFALAILKANQDKMLGSRGEDILPQLQTFLNQMDDHKFSQLLDQATKFSVSCEGPLW